MNREKYFDKINSIISPLLLFPEQLEEIFKVRSNDLEESIDIYLKFSDLLAQLESECAKTRAIFIKMQCSGLDTKEYFEEHRESWGIPKFKEDLVMNEDFKNGFLFTFRDHTSSWCEDEWARDWFFKNVEARFIQNYQFWSSDENGTDEVIENTIGGYKSILWHIVKDGQFYQPLVSPIFSKKELQSFLDNYDEEVDNYCKDEVFAIIENNPNW